MSEEIDHLLQQLKLDIDFSEFHGLLSGLLITIGTQADEIWPSLIGWEEKDEAIHQVELHTISSYIQELAQQLNDPLLGYQLPLSLEFDSPAEQISAIASWCQGVIMGISYTPLPKEEQQSDDLREYLHDLLTFSRIDGTPSSDEDEEDQQALNQISEYLRHGLLLAQEELRPVRHPDVQSIPLH